MLAGEGQHGSVPLFGLLPSMQTPLLFGSQQQDLLEDGRADLFATQYPIVPPLLLQFIITFHHCRFQKNCQPPFRRVNYHT